MASAIQGAVIVREEGKEVKWSFKCDGCGYVESTIRSWHNTGSNVTLTSAQRCPKCRRDQPIRIAGG